MTQTIFNFNADREENRFIIKRQEKNTIKKTLVTFLSVIHFKCRTKVPPIIYFWHFLFVFLFKSLISLYTWTKTGVGRTNLSHRICSGSTWTVLSANWQRIAAKTSWRGKRGCCIQLSTYKCRSLCKSPFWFFASAFLCVCK